MPLTVKQALLDSGMTEEQIAALDAKAVAGITTLVTTAQQDREQAEIAKRAASDLFEKEISPALNNWGNEEARLKAELAFYKAQADAAKSGGFIPNDAPGFKPVDAIPGRDNGGRFVPGANPVPGSPGLDMKEVQGMLGGAMSNALWAMQEYQRVTGGGYLPDSIEVLAAEAEKVHLPFRDYVGRKYQFKEKLEATDKAARDKEKQDFAAAQVAENDRKWAERTGHNPAIRQAESSAFPQLSKAVADKTRPDPLMMERDQRHAATGAAIRKEMSETVQ